MKAITLWQPYASLVALGAKQVEFRTWAPPNSRVGNRIAIHASSRAVVRVEVIGLIRRLERGNASTGLQRDIALPFLWRVLAGLRDKRKGAAVREIWSDVEHVPYACPHSAVLCTAVLGQPKRGDVGARQLWGWPLLDIKPLVPPQAARGQQWLWEWHSNIIEKAA